MIGLCDKFLGDLIVCVVFDLNICCFTFNLFNDFSDDEALPATVR